MKVHVFEPWYDPGHQKLLRALAEGIPGAKVCDVRQYEPCDVAVIFGMVKASYARTQTKAQIIRKHKGPLLVMERGYVRRDEYYSLGFGGINGWADHCNSGMSDDRWKALGVDLKPWRSGGDYVVVCGQVPWDVSVQDTDHRAWCQDTVEMLRRRGYEVRFRPHPMTVTRGVDYGVTPHPKAEIDQARFAVTWNSNSAVDAAVAGVPVVAMNRGSMAWDVAGHDLDAFPPKPDRTQWAADLAYAQWNIGEFRSGAAWAHISRGL